MSMEDLIRRARESISRTRNIGIPQLRNCSGPSSLHTELTQSLRKELQDVRDLTQSMASVVSELPPKEQKSRWDTLSIIEQELDEVNKQMRSAALASKRRIDSQSAAEARNILFHSSKAKPTTSSTNDDALMSATSEVTNRLQEAVALMQQELDRSLLSTQMLDQSTSTLRLTAEQHSTLSGLLSASKGLITDLERADLLDRFILIGGLLLFLACCAYVFNKRIVRKAIAPFISAESATKTLSAISSIASSSSTLLATSSSLSPTLSKHLESSVTQEPPPIATASIASVFSSADSPGQHVEL
ncbi:Sec20-domain-containing protein [Atractiella rhizophila]|nr:Sec20-domain-containing protein [Atractiella rhizophila]